MCCFKAIETHNANTHNPHNTPFKPQYKKNTHFEQPTFLNIYHNTKRHTIQKQTLQNQEHTTQQPLQHQTNTHYSTTMHKTQYNTTQCNTTTLQQTED